MDNIVPYRIQIICIIGSIAFLLYIAYLIVKGRLREEYAIFWIICFVVILTFSIWRNGLEIVSQMLGVFNAPNVVFMGAIFGIFIYLIHLSVVVSKLHEKNKKLSQSIALLKNKINEILSSKTKG